MTNAPLQEHIISPLEQEELRNAEKKMTMLVEKRNNINEQASMFRNERDALNRQKKDIYDRMDEFKAKREELRARMESHKKMRDTYQKRAKGLIEARKQRRAGGTGNEIPDDIELLNTDIMKMEREIETVPMSLAKENEIIDRIKVRKARFDELKKETPLELEPTGDISSVDERIDELFRLADREHNEFTSLLEEVKVINTQMDEEYSLLKHLKIEADKKHQEFMELRERADRVHQQVLDMRKKIMSIRAVHDLKKDEARKVITDQNEAVRATFEDPGALDDKADEAVRLLLKKGKISFK